MDSSSSDIRLLAISRAFAIAARVCALGVFLFIRLLRDD